MTLHAFNSPSPIRLARALIVFVAALAVFLTATPGSAQEPSVFVSAEWLAEHGDDPNVVLLFVGMGHDAVPDEAIPGARFLDYHALAPDNGELRTELAPVADLVDLFRAAGVSSGSHVVVYADRGHVAARAFMTLDYLGHGNRTSVLDGGFAAWKAAGGETTSDLSDGPAGTFEAHVREDMLVSADWIRERLDDSSVTLIDARPDGEYTGERAMTGLRGGHIPGAYNLYWEDLNQSSELPVLRDLDEVKARFEESGASHDGIVVSYCLIGMRASYTYLVSRHLGYDARFYDASWNEWGAREDLPLVAGSGRR